MEYIIILMWIIIIIAIVIIIKYSWKYNLTKEKKTYYKKEINKISKSKVSDSEKILNYDKVLHHILRDLWYSGTLGEILKKKPKEIKDLDRIWKLHKLRNALAHELDTSKHNNLKQKSESFKKELFKLI